MRPPGSRLSASRPHPPRRRGPTPTGLPRGPRPTRHLRAVRLPTTPRPSSNPSFNPRHAPPHSVSLASPLLNPPRHATPRLPPYTPSSLLLCPATPSHAHPRQNHQRYLTPSAHALSLPSHPKHPRPSQVTHATPRPSHANPRPIPTPWPAQAAPRLTQASQKTHALPKPYTPPHVSPKPPKRDSRPSQALHANPTPHPSLPNDSRPFQAIYANLSPHPSLPKDPRPS